MKMNVISRLRGRKLCFKLLGDACTLTVRGTMARPGLLLLDHCQDGVKPIFITVKIPSIALK